MPFSEILLSWPSKDDLHSRIKNVLFSPVLEKTLLCHGKLALLTTWATNDIEKIFLLKLYFLKANFELGYSFFRLLDAPVSL